MGFLSRNFKNILVFNIKKFSNDSVRVRFAPSPTGFVHLGGLRTAFFNYLFARKHNGKFILRIEDTDRERVIPGSLEHIIDTLKWAKLTPDEGPTFGGNHGPYIQSERAELYKEMIGKLIENKSVYHCFCTSKRLELLRREAAKNRETIKYDNRCRFLTNDEIKRNILEGKPYTIRLKLKDGPLTVKDIVYGNVVYDLSITEGDPILVKSDHMPTYHFASVVDDHFMNISHVLRGVEWLISTPKHLMLYEAFGWSVPKFAHLPLILNKDGTKLSKRHDDIRIDSFRDAGYYPETIDNYLTQMGGGFGMLNTADCKQIFTLADLADNFSLKNVNQNSSKIDIEKLKVLNRVCIRQLCKENIDFLIVQLVNLLHKKSINVQQCRMKDVHYIRRVIEWSLDRIFVFDELSHSDLQYLWSTPSMTWDISAFGCKSIENIILKVIEFLNETNDENFMDTEYMLKNLKNIHSETSDLKYGKFMGLLRFSLTNLKVGSPIIETMHLLGKRITIEHMENALDYIKQRERAIV